MFAAQDHRDTQLAPGARRAYRVDFPEQHTLTAELGVPVISRLCFDSDSIAASLAALTWVPGGASLMRAVDRFLPPLPGGDGWTVAVHTAGGAHRWATGRGQSRGTATMTAATVQRLLQGDVPPGVRQMHHLVTLEDVAKAGIDLGGRA
ncbi:hypothetical protein [Sinosporangium siamense]|uniref:Saccharopine dehydrogenase n=1 Tax=Sinosporangium siamense TaxID=1367973 RepID=A0A919RR60_9ACTN|nr:hypothetical protein [Sinosporangium siamense]GII97214.1 hypothetical protein Ssi02_74450 [Sinosporangium siamense]